MFATTGALAPQRSALKRSARLKDVALQLLNKAQNDSRARVPGTLVLSGDERTEKKDLTKNTSEQLRLRCTVEYNGEPK